MEVSTVLVRSDFAQPCGLRRCRPLASTTKAPVHQLIGGALVHHGHDGPMSSVTPSAATTADRLEACDSGANETARSCSCRAGTLPSRSRLLGWCIRAFVKDVPVRCWLNSVCRQAR